MRIAEREGRPSVPARRFGRYGLLVTAVLVAIAGRYVWLRHFAVARTRATAGRRVTPMNRQRHTGRGGATACREGGPMSGDHGDDPLGELEARFRREDPRFARGMERGRPCRPREYRQGRGLLLLAAACALFGAGAAAGSGLLIASGLMAAAGAVHLLDPPRHRPGGHEPPGRGPDHGTEPPP